MRVLYKLVEEEEELKRKRIAGFLVCAGHQLLLR